MKVVETNGIYLSVRRDGTPGGPALVFANSLGTDLRLWDDTVTALPAAFDVLRYDKRGHGLSSAPPPPYRMADHAGDLIGLLDAQGIETAIVCGISVGGMIALQAALDAPDRIAGLVLMDTGFRIGTADGWQQRIDTVMAEGLGELADNIVLGWLSDAYRQANPGAAQAWRNMVARTPAPHGYAGTCAALRDTDLTARLSEIPQPALVLCGSDDPSTPPALNQQLAELLPHARYQEIAETRHLPCIEKPGEVAGLIADFVRETAGD
ncbi:3-oxoadipate enol-lactonase [Rhodovibrio salinarum]|uniref:3-oxoadipate enol-lactonase n=1 Tax=Rhodovibrio salinarum TaxID=1087 RepID=A0A934V091_9PROT|nr:3-oxoadipate enol-lactonase [Rhodovibrio salinarum]MBK1697543.1 3-oxoadipate enol-lactonase [Rhodovibrio salinarum]